MVPQLYTPLPFGTYYYQTIQRPKYFQNLMQEYKYNPGHFDNSQVDTSGDKNSIPCLICLPVCPCWCCMQLYYYYALLVDPNGEEIVTFPEETAPISSGIPAIPGMPISIGGIMGPHGLPVRTHPIVRK